MTTADQLTSVRNLIASIEAAGVAGYSVGGLSYSYQDLGKLYAREKELIARQRAETGVSFSLAQPITD
ncbi:MAG: hypothetical protein AB7O62_00350 [Pirellulales bacterium]